MTRESRGRSVLAVALVAAIWGLVETTPVRAAQPRQPVTVPGIFGFQQMLPSFVAHAAGYFDEEGIDLRDYVFGAGSTIRAALIAGQYDFSTIGFVHIPLMRQAGARWKVVLSLYDRHFFTLVARSQLKDRVRTVADLKGYRVGYSAPGSYSWAIGQVFLRRSGLDPDRDVQYVTVGGDAQVKYTAIATGRVDAYVAEEPTSTRVIEEGVAYPLTRVWEEAEHVRWFGAPNAITQVLIAREDVIRSQPQLVEAMVRAHQRGLAFIRTRPASEVVDLVLGSSKTAQYFQGLGRDLVVKMVERLKPGFGTGCISRSAFEVEMKLELDYRLVPQPITFEEFAEPRWAGECP